jgi:hypothetical protein
MPLGKLERLMFELSSKIHGKKVHAGAEKAAAEELDVSEIRRSCANLLGYDIVLEEIDCVEAT